MSPKFGAWSETNWSTKLDISSPHEVRTKNGVVGVLHSFRDWISLQTHWTTPPTILWCSLCFGLDPKSIGHRNGLLQARTNFMPKMEWLVHCIVLKIGFHSILTKELLPPCYDVAQVLGPIRNQLVNELGHFKFVRCSCRTFSGYRIAKL